MFCLKTLNDRDDLDRANKQSRICNHEPMTRLPFAVDYNNYCIQIPLTLSFTPFLYLLTILPGHV